MRLVIAFVLVAACGPTTTTKQGTGPTRVGGGTGPAKPTGTTPIGAIPDVGCLAPSCAYHAGANSYFTCTAGGAGNCFHFGSPCAPADSCMYDSADRTYKKCGRIVEGACQQWGAACAPASACMFAPAEGLHRKCDDVSGGACKRYGALCAP